MRVRSIFVQLYYYVAYCKASTTYIHQHGKYSEISLTYSKLVTFSTESSNVVLPWPWSHTVVLTSMAGNNTIQTKLVFKINTTKLGQN